MRRLLLILLFFSFLTHLHAQNDNPTANFDDHKFELFSVENRHMLSQDIIDEIESIEKGFNNFVVNKLNEKIEQKVSIGSYFDEDAYLSQLLSMNNPSASEANALKGLYYRSGGYVTKLSKRTMILENKVLKTWNVSNKDLIDFYGGFSAIAAMNKTIEELDLSLILQANSMEIVSYPNVQVNATYIGTNDALKYHNIKDKDVTFDITFNDLDLTLKDIYYFLNVSGNISLDYTTKLEKESELLSDLDPTIAHFLTKRGTGFNSTFTFKETDEVMKKAKNDFNVLELILDTYITDEFYYQSELYAKTGISTFEDCNSLPTLFDDYRSLEDNYYNNILKNTEGTLIVAFEEPWEIVTFEDPPENSYYDSAYDNDFLLRYPERLSFGERVKIDIKSILTNHKVEGNPPYQRSDRKKTILTKGYRLGIFRYNDLYGDDVYYPSLKYISIDGKKVKSLQHTNETTYSVSTYYLEYRGASFSRLNEKISVDVIDNSTLVFDVPNNSKELKKLPYEGRLKLYFKVNVYYKYPQCDYYEGKKIVQYDEYGREDYPITLRYRTLFKTLVIEIELDTSKKRMKKLMKEISDF